MLPLQLLVPILCKAGAWKAGGHTVSAWSVCKEWRDAVRGSTPHMAAMLVATHGPSNAVIAACSMPVMVNLCPLLRHLLLNVREEILAVVLKLALPNAAYHGHEDVVQLLLDWPQHAPHAECQGGEAASRGHAAVMSRLLQHATDAGCLNNEALAIAAAKGHAAVVKVLLQQPKHAPRADCQNGRALIFAAKGGHAHVVRLLLLWPVHAPRADCQGGRALLVAAGGGHEEVVQLLEGWPQHAPQASAILMRVVAVFASMAALYQGFATPWTVIIIGVAGLGLERWMQRHASDGINHRHDMALKQASAAGYWKLTLHVFGRQRPLRSRLGLAGQVTGVVALVALIRYTHGYFAWRSAHQSELAEPISGIETHFPMVNHVASILMMVCMAALMLL